MSYSASGWVDQIAPLIASPACIAVLGYLARCMNHGDGRCFPKVATIAAKTGFSERSVQYALRWLERAGLLTWQSRGPRKTRLYVLNVGRTPRPPETGSGGTPACTQGVQMTAFSAPLEVQNPHPEREEESNQKEEPSESTSPQAAPLTPAPDPVDQISTTAEPEPDDDQPIEIEPEMRREIEAAGLDPDDQPVRTMHADWHKSPKPLCTRLSPDWRVSAVGWAYAIAAGFTDARIVEMERKFIRQYTAITPNIRVGSWDARWEKWVDDEPRFAPRHRDTTGAWIFERRAAREAAAATGRNYQSVRELLA